MKSPSNQASKTELALLLADALVAEATEIERRAWSPRTTEDFEPATAATERRMRTQFIQSRARAAHEQEVNRMSQIESLRNERNAVEQARNDASGAQKGVLTKKLRELDARIAEFEIGEESQDETPVREFATGTADTIDEAVADKEQRDAEKSVEPSALEDAIDEPQPQPSGRKPKEPTPVEPPEGTGERVAAILRAGVPVPKAELVDAVIADAQGTEDPDLVAMGDVVVSNGLLKAYGPTWVGRWLGNGPEKTARKRLAEAAA